VHFADKELTGANRMRTALLLGFSLIFPAISALAQGQNAFAVNGTVDAIGSASISIKNNLGGAVDSFRLSPNLLVVQNKRVTMGDIKPNDYIASAAVRKDDGKLYSTELRIFPDALRGTGEGQRPMNDARSQTMTNATVTGTVIVGGRNNITVRFPGGDSELIVEPDVIVTAIMPVDKNLVKPGTRVRAQGTKTADGMIISRITLE